MNTPMSSIIAASLISLVGDFAPLRTRGSLSIVLLVWSGEKKARGMNWPDWCSTPERINGPVAPDSQASSMSLQWRVPLVSLLSARFSSTVPSLRKSTCHVVHIASK